MHVVGLDIGGANLKAAHVDGPARSRPFPVWKNPDGLAPALAGLLLEFPRADALAVTMTAELADCFETKAEGVERILASVEAVAAGRPVQIWQTGGEFVSPDEARANPNLVAAANWHAQATWLGRLAPEGESLLIDIGSTTTDIIPISNGLPVPEGITDPERLLSGELVYTGARRTPVCAVVRSLPFRDGPCPVAAELFATTLDVYLILGEVAEDPTDCDTANGRPATIAAARDRLARMLCCDRDEFTEADALEAARFVAAAQTRQIETSLAAVLARRSAPYDPVILSGSGAFLAERVVAAHPSLAASRTVRLREILPAGASDAACAFAVARLAAGRA